MLISLFTWIAGFTVIIFSIRFMLDAMVLSERINNPSNINIEKYERIIPNILLKIVVAGLWIIIALHLLLFA
jgi:Trk-type K+ transport system membrane component